MYFNIIYSWEMCKEYKFESEIFIDSSDECEH